MCSYLNMTFLWALLAAALDPAKYAFSVAHTAPRASTLHARAFGGGQKAAGGLMVFYTESCARALPAPRVHGT